MSPSDEAFYRRDEPPPPRGGPRRIEPIEYGQADLRVVGDLIEDLRAAWETIINDYADGRTSAGNLKTERGGVRYIDAWMAVHNFFKLVADNLVADAGLTGRPAAEFYRSVGFTFSRAMDARAAQIHPAVPADPDP